MHNRHLPSALTPIALFFVVGMLSAHFSGALTLKGFLISLTAAIGLVIFATQANRGPYI